MSFKDELLNRDLGFMLEEHTFRKIVPQNADRFAKMIFEIVNRNLRVYIDPDCDPDGYFSAKIMQTMFDSIGFSNYVIGHHEYKRHTIPLSYIASLVREDFDVFLIVDSTTNSMQLIQYLCDEGKICMIVDHHEPDYRFSDYPDECIIVNPKLDALYTKVVYDQLSAGAICALLCDYTLKTQFNISAPIDVYLFGVITLYSDICNMSNPYNIAYVTQYQNTNIINSELIKMFWNEKYSHFDRSYISFTFVPKINALMRLEKFDLLYKLFFEANSVDYCKEAQNVLAIYSESKERAERLISRCRTEQYDSFTIAYMPEDCEAIDKNFTGYVANSIGNTLNQPVLCLFADSPQQFCGSVRDPFSRNLLSVFKPLCYAAGHTSAFGVRIDTVSLQSIVLTLNNVKQLFSNIRDDVIICDWNRSISHEELVHEFKLMADYNEFGGQGLPKAMGFLKVSPRAKIYRNSGYTSIYDSGSKFTCFTTAVDVGDTMLVSPSLSGSDYQLIVNNVSFADSTLNTN